MAFSWKQADVKTINGVCKGIAPVIISASRSTDIPGFYGKWFMNRLKAGYVRWNNPFNAAQPQYVSFQNARVIVFWTKNAAPFEKYLDELDSYHINYYFTYTINDYEKEAFEPGIPALVNRIESFQRLAERVGKERVIWRFDPLILTSTLSVEELLRRAEAIGECLHSYTQKMVFSFADIGGYKKVERNLTAHTPHWRSFSVQDMKTFAEGISAINKKWGLSLATCGEEVDLASYGILPNSCVDGELMLRLFPKDRALWEFLAPQYKMNAEPQSLFEEERTEFVTDNINANYKDKGQREACGCVVSKDIGQYNTCPHHCVYCYANFSRKTVDNNCSHFDEKGETIISPMG